MNKEVFVDNAKPLFGEPIGGWHKYFCWLPVRTFDHCIIWLNLAYRRRIQKHDYLTGGPEQWWQYSHVKNKSPKEQS